jgi:putative spermidine/putrescine transport system substrate-binding protein
VEEWKLSHFRKTLPVALAGSMLLAGQAFGGDAINLVSWGGAWSAAVKGAWTDSYEEETGQGFNFIDYNGGVAEIRAQSEAGNVTWDIVDMIPGDLTIACDEGLVEELETPDADDWFDTHPCGIGIVIWATVMAYKDSTYADEKPTTVADYWDFDRFPGKRSMRKAAEVNLEWALIADGVPVGDVYEVLSTEEGVDRAFAKLDQVKEESVWWEAGAQAPQILVDGEAAIATAYNGRIYNAQVKESQPLSIMWDSQVWDIGFMAIPKGAANADAAREFLTGKFASPEYQGRITYHIAYGPMRKSASEFNNPEIKGHLPTDNINEHSLQFNYLFWADHRDELQERFSAWLAL